MKIVKYGDSSFQEVLDSICNRVAFPDDIEASVAGILKDIREQGNKALSFYARKFDKVCLEPNEFLVSEEEIEAAAKKVSVKTRKAIKLAFKNVSDFSRQSTPKPWTFTPRKGVVLGERFEPLDRVACYVPGGTAPLVSTILHTVTMAKVAGVKEIVVITPVGPDKQVHPAILYAAKVAGATEVYRLGGVYGVGAVAYGTDTIPKVEKIVGPGNAYVTAAKRQVYGYSSLDLVAGPSEILVIADETANPAFVAADMMSQAEHGSGFEQAVCVTTSEELAKKIQAQVLLQMKRRKRQDHVQKVYNEGMFIFVVDDMEEAVKVTNDYAPEHLEIQTKQAGQVAKKIKSAGAIFIGHYTPESVGDFVAGPSHVLPTGGAAKYFSGLTVEHFYRRMSVVSYTKSALKEELWAVEEIARNEGLDAHGYAAAVRFESE